MQGTGSGSCIEAWHALYCLRCYQCTWPWRKGRHNLILWNQPTAAHRIPSSYNFSASESASCSSLEFNCR